MKSCVRSGFIVAALAVASIVAACGQPTKFDQASFSDASSVQKNAGSYWKHDGWWGGIPKDVHRVAITQFTVEYVTQNTSKSGADTLSVLGALELAGVGKRKRVFTDEFKQSLPTPMYDAFVAAMLAEEMEVVPMADLQKHPAFAELKAGEAGSSYGQNARGILGVNRNESAVMQVYPAKGLPLIDDGWFNGGNNALAEAKLVGDNGAQCGLRVRIRVALDDDGHAVLDKGAVITAMYDLKKEDWRSKGPEWIMKQRGNVVSSGAMRDDVAVIDSKEFKAFQGDVYTVNGPQFQESIFKMYPTFARMAAVKLKG